MQTTRAARGQASASFLLTFAALVAAVFVLFSALSYVSRNEESAVLSLGQKAECAEQSAAYALWGTGFSGFSYYLENGMVLQNSSAYAVCGEWKETMGSETKQKGWI
jgi:hypothetical protein